MITKEEVRTRLFHMVSIFLVSALITMCGYISIPALTIAELDPNTLTVLKFLTMMAFIVNMMGMISMTALLVGDTHERVVRGSEEEDDGE